LLITKPGFLSAEYKRGRRASYLNPVRMYIFTSFVFFIIFFSAVSYITEDGFNVTSVSGVSVANIERMDSTEFADFTKMLTQGKRVLSKQEYRGYIDSITTDSNYTIIGDNYKNREEYDSLVNAGKVKHNWFWKKITEKNFELKDKYKSQQQVVEAFFNKLIHYFPQILFVSLPFFALFLKLIYVRRKEFYFVSHGIYSVHLYIFYFISLLISLLLNILKDATDWGVFGLINTVLILLMLFYEYKAMRHFYAQRRAKTIFKFLLAFFGRLIIIILLFVLFFFLSIYNL
jgi:hypothetical protein